MRQNISDLNCITKPKSGIKETVTTKLSKYNNKGLVGNKLTDDNVAATTLDINGKTTYKIKINNRGKAYDPLNNSLGEKSPSTKELTFKLRTVNKKCFDLYVLFLQKRTGNLLVAAEREM